MTHNEELQVIIKYEINKLMSKLIDQVEGYDCSTHQKDCVERGKDPLECKGAQATAKVIIETLREWEYYL